MKKIIVLLLVLGFLLTALTGCELFAPDQTQRPNYATGGGGTEPSSTPNDGTEPPADDNYGFTVFPEGNYLADPVFGTDEYLPGYDYSKSYSYSGNNACATEDTLYFAYGDILYYVDKSTGFSGPLCGKPECTHDKDSCNAYLGETIWGLSNYNGRIYWVDSSAYNWKIFSVAYDGTDRQNVNLISSDIVGHSLYDLSMFFHRGCFYLSYIYNTVVDGEPRYLARVVALPLNEGEDGYVILETEWNGLINIQPYRDSLYILLVRDSVDNVITNDFVLYRWDIQTREAETLYQKSSLLLVDDFYVTGDGIILYLETPTNPAAEDPWITAEDNVYKFSFESGELEKLYNFSPDVTMFKVTIVDGALIGAKWTDEGILTLRAKDFEGQTLLDTAIEGIEWYDPNRLHSFITCIGADDAYIYFQDETQKNTYYAAIPWDGSEVKLLWSSES